MGKNSYTATSHPRAQRQVLLMSRILRILLLLLPLPVLAQNLPLPTTAPMHGKAAALVTIIAVGDFQCPFCRRLSPNLARLEAEFPNDVRVMWLNLPLPFHANAKPAAVLAAAAQRKGKFWPLYAKFMDESADLSPDGLRTMANQIGLSNAEFDSSQRDSSLSALVENDARIAALLGVSGTPTVVVNGALLVGAQPYEKIKEKFEQALRSAQQIAWGQRDAKAQLAAIFSAQNPKNADILMRYVFGSEPAPQAPPALPKPDADDGYPDSAKTLWKIPVDAQDATQAASEQYAITIVEFSDFQCPFCQRGATTLKAVQAKYGDKLRLVFKHNPLPFHPRAKDAALAALAAGRQGKFWPFHDKIFKNQQHLPERDFSPWAQELGLNIPKFVKDVRDPALLAQIEADQKLAVAVQALGTPIFFINGRKISGAQPQQVFEQVIDRELAQVLPGQSGATHYQKLIANGQQLDQQPPQKSFRTEHMPYFGPPSARFTVVVFTDFQCPYCAIAAPILRQFQQAHKDEVRVIVMQMPLDFHDMAGPAAVLAQIAFEKGGPALFERAYDRLFAGSAALDADFLVSVANNLGISPSEYQTALSADKYGPLFGAVRDEADAKGVEGTPTIFVNGRKFEPAGGLTLAEFERALAGPKR